MSYHSGCNVNPAVSAAGVSAERHGNKLPQEFPIWKQVVKIEGLEEGVGGWGGVTVVGEELPVKICRAFLQPILKQWLCQLAQVNSVDSKVERRCNNGNVIHFAAI